MLRFPQVENGNNDSICLMRGRKRSNLLCTKHLELPQTMALNKVFIITVVVATTAIYECMCVCIYLKLPRVEYLLL